MAAAKIFIPSDDVRILKNPSHVNTWGSRSGCPPPSRRSSRVATRSVRRPNRDHGTRRRERRPRRPTGSRPLAAREDWRRLPSQGCGKKSPQGMGRRPQTSVLRASGARGRMIGGPDAILREPCFTAGRTPAKKVLAMKGMRNITRENGHTPQNGSAGTSARYCLPPSQKKCAHNRQITLTKKVKCMYEVEKGLSAHAPPGHGEGHGREARTIRNTPTIPASRPGGLAVYGHAPGQKTRTAAGPRCGNERPRPSPSPRGPARVSGGGRTRLPCPTAAAWRSDRGRRVLVFVGKVIRTEFKLMLQKKINTKKIIRRLTLTHRGRAAYTAPALVSQILFSYYV